MLLATRGTRKVVGGRGPARVLLGGALLVVCGCVRGLPETAPIAAAEPPALVLLLVVDQLRPDRVVAELPGGLGRLVREGRVFEDAALGHAGSETCPGHAALASGRHPGPAGIPGNAFFLPDRAQAVYCVADESARGELLGAAPAGAEEGRSPHYLRVTALGDWLREQRPGARVFSVSGKDRAAIMLGGQHPDAAFWIDRRAAGGFTTSRHYLDRLPGWVQRWNAAERWRSLPEQWQHASGDPPNGTRRDDFPGEATRFSRRSPHPLRVDADLKETFARLQVSPELDSLTLAFASELLVQEKLGRGPEPDLLAISLSATDFIGHYYGPFSQESRNALERLDEELGSFLRRLEERVGEGGLLVVLTADHGVLPLPEWLAAEPAPESGCPVPGGRVDARALDARLQAWLDQRFPGGAGAAWFAREDYVLAFAASRIEARGLSRAEVVEAARDFLAAQTDAVERVWSREQIASGAGPEPFASLYRNSWAEGRDGDLVIQPRPGCLLSPWPEGTGHGSPYFYDLRIPLVFSGRGVVPGRVAGAASAVDVAPTLARALGIRAPGDLDGHALSLGAPDEGARLKPAP